MTRVLFIAGWNDPFGDFTKEHAYAVATHCEINYVYIEFVKSWRRLPFKISFSHETSNHVTQHFVRIACPVRRLGIFEFLTRTSISSLVRRIYQKYPPDLIHVNVLTPVTEVIIDFAKSLNLPVIITEHSTFYHFGIYKAFRGIALDKKIQSIKARLNSPEIKAILPVSAHLGNILINNFAVSERKLIVVPNVAAAEFVYSGRISNSNFRIMLAAHWENQKNPMLFFRSLTYLPLSVHSKIEIAVIGEGSQLKEVRQFNNEQHRSVDCKFIGPVTTRNEMATWFQNSDVFIHPSNAENLPCVIIESLCCGTPVISNNVGGVSELVNESNGLLSDPGDEKTMAYNILYMINNLDKYDRKKISEQALAKYSAEAVGTQIYSVYKKVTFGA